jgi:hypothetical protein
MGPAFPTIFTALLLAQKPYFLKRIQRPQNIQPRLLIVPIATTHSVKCAQSRAFRGSEINGVRTFD